MAHLLEPRVHRVLSQLSLSAERDQLSGRVPFHERTRAIDPLHVRVGLREAARLVGELPRHDRRIAGVRHAGNRVPPHEHGARVALKELLRGIERVEAGGIVLKFVPGMTGRLGIGDGRSSCPGDVLRHPSTPLEEVVENEHGAHVTLRQLGKNEVEAAELILVVTARRFLDCGMNALRLGRRSLA